VPVIRKYSELAPPDAAPVLSFDLPELQYPERLNAVKTVFDGARENGWSERTVFYADNQAYTFADVEALVARSMAALRALDICHGDVVILRIPDTLDLVTTLLAVQGIGAIAMPTYAQLRADDLVYRADDADARLLIASADLLDEALPVVHARGGKTTVVAISGDPGGRCHNFADFLPEGEISPDYLDTDAEELCLFLYTSGSTGVPKGTTHCHRDMLAVSDSYWRYCLAPGQDDVLSGTPSIAFALGFGMFVYFPLRLGHAAILEPDKSPETALAQIQQYNVTIFAGVVSYYNVLARLIRETGADVSSLVHPMTGGEPLTEEIERFWLEVTGVRLEQFIGTTEMLHCFVTSTRPGELPHTATLGHAVPGYDVAVLDPETFEELPDGEHGLFASRGPTGTVYWNKPDQQEKVVRKGWNVFQDVVWRDEHGDFQYVARHDEMIISSGYNISPVQVENVLMQHDAVVECACVAAPDPDGRRGAIVKAYVVVNDRHEAGEPLAADLQYFVKNNAAPYMYPRAISFEDVLPKTINGKILRSELRERARSEGEE
jgi:2-aminobenzoate-CoA ligase